MPNLKVDLTGKTFGRFLVLKKSLKINSEGVHWICKCNCGNVKHVSEHSLRLGRSKSCGCLCREIVGARIKNLVGRRFGRLTVILENKIRDKWGHVLWLCKCDCGKSKTVIGSSLSCGLTKSCGCLAREVSSGFKGFKNPNFIHGMTKTKIYNTWRGMLSRCFNAKDDHFNRYGGRGVTVFKRWMNFVYFKKWAIGNGYADGLTIDRIDNDGNYEPSNCQWLTRSENTKKQFRDHKVKSAQ